MKILIVEDEEKIAGAIKKGLENERIVCDVVYDGESGVMSAEADEYDVIILDRMLPEMDGIEVCKKLRANGNSTPILMLTALGEIGQKVMGLNSGADDYLAKPFSFEELLARVRALARRPKNVQNQVLQVEDLVLDPVSVNVFRGDTPVSLTQKEFALLEYMMKNQGRVLSRDMLISNVWDFDADILPNTVEAFVANLRKKIDKKFRKSPSLIQTVRGFGYKFEPVKNKKSKRDI